MAGLLTVSGGQDEWLVVDRDRKRVERKDGFA